MKRRHSPWDLWVELRAVEVDLGGFLPTLFVVGCLIAAATLA